MDRPELDHFNWTFVYDIIVCHHVVLRGDATASRRRIRASSMDISLERNLHFHLPDTRQH